MNAHDLKLDHFLVYRTIARPVQEVVRLRGQFDERPEWLKLERVIWFANPVSKNGEPLFDKNAHLVCYRPPDPVAQPPRVVEIENQFDRATIYLDDVIGLLAPARKRERGLGFPEKLDHYKLYDAHAERPIMKPVKLQDQFGATEAIVFQVEAFAVPVAKRHEDNDFPIHNDRAHLTLYSISRSRPFNRDTYFQDQFGWHHAYRFQRFLLAVPSVKLGWNEGW